LKPSIQTRKNDTVAAFQKEISVLVNKMQALNKDRVAYQKYAETDSYFRNRLALIATEYQELSDKVAELRRRLASFKKNPARSFVPLGAVVVITSVPTGADHGYPVVGSKGIVSGFNKDNSAHIRVSFPDGCTTQWNIGEASGTEDWLPCEDSEYNDRIMTFYAMKNNIRVVGYGTLPDGSVNKDNTFVPNCKLDRNSPEMIIKSMGWYVRLGEVNGEVEPFGMARNMNQMSFLKMPNF